MSKMNFFILKLCGRVFGFSGNSWLIVVILWIILFFRSKFKMIIINLRDVKGGYILFINDFLLKFLGW